MRKMARAPSIATASWGVIDAGQTLEHAGIGSAVKDDVHRPHCVGYRWSKQRLPIAQGHFFALTATSLSAFLPIQPFHPRVVHRFALLSQRLIDHSHTVARVAQCKVHDS